MWRLADYTASLSLASLSAEVQVLEPWRGLCAPKWLNTELNSSVSVLQVDVRELIAPNRLPLDCYLRGNDVVANYAPSEGRNVQTQIYWRAIEPDCGARAAGIELIISAQTHLLDSRPGLTTVSVLPTGPVFRLSTESSRLDEIHVEIAAKREFFANDRAGLLLFRPPGATYSYAEMVHPSDLSGRTLETRGENRLRVTNHLFNERLEKGVIRRARTCGLF